jgi:tripartite ATP-independent transporter DctM subunit
MSGSELLCLAMFFSVMAMLMSGFPVAFVLAGTSIIFAFVGAAVGVFDTALMLAFPQRVFATMSSEIWVAIPLFIFMGVLLERSRVAEDLLETMGRLFGGLPGGLAVSVSVVGMLMAASTGIVGATVVTMGLLSLPTMLKHGYDGRFASGSIAACGTLGQIIPPSIVLVLLGDQLSNAYQRAQLDQGITAPDAVSVNDLFAGALLPGLLLVVLYVVYQLSVAAIRPHAAPALPRSGTPMMGDGLAGDLVRTMIAPVGLIVAVLGSILAGIASPTEAASVGAVGALLLAAQRQVPRRRWPIFVALAAFGLLAVLMVGFDLKVGTGAGVLATPTGALAVLLCGLGALGIARAVVTTARPGADGTPAVLQDAMRATLRVSAMIFAIVIGASMFALVFRGLGGGALIETYLRDLPGGAAGAVLVVMAVMFVMGFFLDFLEIVFIVVPIVAPVLLQMEFADGAAINPVWLGIMMAIILQTSFLTPPFGFALFYLRGVAPDEVSTLDIYRGVIPFVALQIAAVAIVWFAPAMATWLPEALYAR